MKYRVTTENGGYKEVYFDIPEFPPEYPNPSEIIEAAKNEFPGVPMSDLAVVPEGGGDAIILMLAPLCQNVGSKKEAT